MSQDDEQHWREKEREALRRAADSRGLRAAFWRWRAEGYNHRKIAAASRGRKGTRF